MPYVNKIEIMGNLGRDPELRYMPDGRAVTNVSVAVQKTWNDRETGKAKERTEWFTVVLYGGQAETVCRLMSAGDCLQVWGEIQSRRVQGRDGSEKTVYEVIAKEMQIIRTAPREKVSGGIHDMMKSPAGEPVQK